jgi:hypothetical protein
MYIKGNVGTKCSVTFAQGWMRLHKQPITTRSASMGPGLKIKRKDKEMKGRKGEKPRKERGEGESLTFCCRDSGVERETHRSFTGNLKEGEDGGCRWGGRRRICCGSPFQNQNEEEGIFRREAQWRGEDDAEEGFLASPFEDGEGD